MLDKQRLSELVKEVDPLEQLDDEVEDVSNALFSFKFLVYNIEAKTHIYMAKDTSHLCWIVCLEAPGFIEHSAREFF